MNAIWKNDNEFGIYDLTKDNGKIVCRLIPKMSLRYIDFVGEKVFENEETYVKWFYESNIYYGDTSPYDISLRDVFDRLMRIEYSIYI